MRRILPLKGRIQPYQWGSLTAIPDLLGVQPDGSPQAELWLGAHPVAPSRVEKDGGIISLIDLIEKLPDQILGHSVALKYDNHLPFLFKVLAAAKPLSIQAHPNAQQAAEGFEKESGKGIKLDAHNRSYKDRNHKPECICAITEFWALNGFRKIETIIPLLGAACPETLAPELARLSENSHTDGLKVFFEGLMTKSETEVESILAEAVGRAEIRKETDPAFSWLLKLHGEYPRDIGALSPVILNLIRLTPGEALYLEAGRLHAYLDGVGIELMANSDNVLRGGLTAKHIDLPELLKVLSFEETVPDILSPSPDSQGERTYPTPAEEFVLSEISTSKQVHYRSPEKRSVEIILCVKGSAKIFGDESGSPAHIKKGESILIPASLDGYSIEGDSLLYKATVSVS